MIYDSIIIGAGPAGISTSLYAKRSNLNILVLYHDNSGLLKAKQIDNYYGTPSISGEDLFNTGLNQAKSLGVEIKKEEVLSIKMEMIENSFGYMVETTDEKYQTRTVVISTGVARSMPNIANIKDYKDTNISYCAICDGFFYYGKKVAVLGFSKYALAEAKELLKVTNDVTILTNGNELNEELPDTVKLITDKIVAFKGTNKIEQIEFTNKTVDIDGVFIAWGTAGGYEFAKKVGIETNNNIIVVNNKMETNVPGIYACGDITGAPYQIYKAVYEGATAAKSISEYLKK